jgi:NAD(P)-dependent dehydrogenase (short-subunit alcohol dehydrogenase family)
VYVSSGLHNGGDSKLSDITWSKRGEQAWSDSAGYADSKFQIVLFSKAVARLWPGVKSNSLDPGWVPTKMGGASASGDLGAAVKTYVKLVQDDLEATGKYFYSSNERSARGETDDVQLQDKLLKICEEVTGIPFPKQ